MAISSNTFPAFVLVLALFTSFVSLAWSSASYRTDGKLHRGSVDGLHRNKRQICPDGEYTYNGRTCCKCAAGQMLLRNCVSQPNDRECKFCEDGSYNSDPNYDTTCKPCTSCDHPNSNLEVDEPCTSARDTKCRCKKDHYCTGSSQPRFLCSPCEVCGNEGIKIACTATSNTVCNGKSEEGTQAGKTVGIVLGILIPAAVGVGVGVAVFLKWRQNRQGQTDRPEEDLPLKDIRPHVPEIADALGWKVMERLALRSGIKQPTIESCKLDHPGDSQAQTQKLLGIWVELQGKGASERLIQMLKESLMRDKARDVKHILDSGSAARSNGPV